MKRLETIKPAVEAAAKAGGLPAPVVPLPVGFDGDAWVWTWRGERKIGEEKEMGIAEASVVARPEASDGVEIRVSARAWMPHRRHVVPRRLFYSRFFEHVPSVEVLTVELREPLYNAWQNAIGMADQLPQTEKARTAFLDSLKTKGLLG